MNRTRVEVIAQMKDEIISDVMAGCVPADVGDFCTLHDYRDANCYGGFCDDEVADSMLDEFGGPDEDEGMPEGMLDFIAACQNEIDLWLRAGGLLLAVK